MLDIEREIYDEVNKQKQNEHLRRLKKNREKQAEVKNNERRIFIIGRLFLEIFPEYLLLQPKISEDENQTEFAPLRNFFLALASEKKFVDALKAKAATISTSRNIQNAEEKSVGR